METFTLRDGATITIEQIKQAIPKSYFDQEIRHGFNFNDYPSDWLNLYEGWMTSTHQEYYIERG